MSVFVPVLRKAAVQEPPTPSPARTTYPQPGQKRRDLVIPRWQSPSFSALPAVVWDQIFGRKVYSGGPFAEFNRIGCSHVADQLCDLWQRIILGGCQDVSNPSFTNLAVVWTWADVGRCGRLCVHIGTRFGQALGSKIRHPLLRGAMSPSILGAAVSGNQ